MSNGHMDLTQMFDEEQTVSNPVEPVVMRDAIKLFFNEMVAECSGSDNGVDAVLDDYVTDNVLRPFMEHYISKI